MWLVDADTARRLDQAAMEAGLSGLTLMETAGRAAAALLLAVAGPPTPGRPAVVLAGAGNNGGDGLTVARWLARWTTPRAVRVYLLADPARLRGEAAVQWRLLQITGVPTCWLQTWAIPGPGSEEPTRKAPRGEAPHGDGPPPRGLEAGTGPEPVSGPVPWDAFLAGLWADAGRALVAVDALLGLGARGTLRSHAARALAALAAGGAPLLALDLPSGLDPDSGQATPETPRARWTVTFGAPKWGLVLGEGPQRAGTVLVVDIGWPGVRQLPNRLREAGATASGPASTAPVAGPGGNPEEGEQGGGQQDGAAAAMAPARSLEQDDGVPAARVLDAALVASLLPRRPVDAHKGSAGHVVVVGGRRGQGGAPTLAGRAALRAGAGLVTVAVPAGLRPEVAGRDPTLMTWALPEMDGEVAANAGQALEALEQERPGTTVRVIGPGLGRGPGAAACVARWLGLEGGQPPGSPRPTVLDADGLNLVAALGAHRLRRRPADLPLVLTPHPGEAARLLGVTGSQVQARRPRAALELAHRTGAVVVLKGAGTLVADPQGALFFCPRGHPGMASAGMGDALAGVIGALLAQGLNPLAAAAAGVYVHALAGELAALRLGGDAGVAGGPEMTAARWGPRAPALATGVADGGAPMGGTGDFPAGDRGAAFIPVTADMLIEGLPEALRLGFSGWPDGQSAYGVAGVRWLRPPLLGRHGARYGEP